MTERKRKPNRETLLETTDTERNRSVQETENTTFSLDRTDESGGPATASSADNQPPETENDFGAGSADDAVIAIGNVLLNDSDPDGDALVVSEVDKRASKVGEPVAGNNGGYWIINSNGNAEFHPDGDFKFLSEGEEITETILYTVSDGKGGTEYGAAYVTLTGSNDAPVAVDDEYGVAEDSFFVALNLSGDKRLVGNDIEHDNGDVLNIVAVNGQALTGNSMTVEGSNGGLFQIYSDGRARLSAESGFDSLAVGESLVTSIEYTVEDSHGERSTATVDMVVTGTNDEVTTFDDEAVTDEATAVVIEVLENDVDIDNDELSVLSVDTTGLKGKVTINNDGTLSYDPDGQFDDLAEGETATETFTYVASDGNGSTSEATVEVLIEGINQPPAFNVDPVAGNDFGSGSEDDTVISLGNLLDNDTDANPGDTLEISKVERKASNVGQPVDGEFGGYWIVESDGTAEFHTEGDFDFLAVGEQVTEHLLYNVSDGNGGSDFGAAYVTIVGTNNGPVALDDEYLVREGSFFYALNIFGDKRLIANDVDADGDAVTIVEVNGQALSGNSITVSGSDGGTFQIYADGRARLGAENDFAYLNAGETAVSSVEYTVSDSHGARSTATVDMIVTGVGNDFMDA